MDTRVTNVTTVVIRNQIICTMTTLPVNKKKDKWVRGEYTLACVVVHMLYACVCVSVVEACFFFWSRQDEQERNNRQLPIFQLWWLCLDDASLSELVKQWLIGMGFSSCT